MNVLKNLLNELPKKNLENQFGRSVSIFILVMILAFSLFLATFITMSLRNGMQSMEARMGADAIILPRDSENEYEGALISGTPSNFYMEIEYMNQIAQIDEVEKYSPQVYVTSADASCCASPMQIIGIDPATDFSVRPWLTQEVSGNLADDEVFAGRNIIGGVGEKIQLYGKDYTIKGKLSDTGLGFDESTFLNLDEAREIAEKAKDFGLVAEEADSDEYISNIMVDTIDSIPVSKGVSAINRELAGTPIRAQSTSDMISMFASQMSQTTRYILVIVILLWVLSLVILFIVFSIMVRSRSDEWQAMKIIGASEKQMRTIVQKESVILSASGALAGVVLAIIVALLFKQNIEHAVELPILTPNLAVTILIAGVSLLICSLLGPIASSVALNKEINDSQNNKE